ncbi:substrate-binding periplasmic protein [Marinobacter daqiaonensis]|uniref:substrate-binding periplasmic protein n=1 Tax=Marinobacter daqiaonensis TaxID=650891 RepID=UPI001432DA03|nr:transporter substrate-binding domain-containing protein [Marinobacter daqiaonensis]
MADKRPEIRAAYVEFPPLSYTDNSGEAAGEIVGLAKRLAEHAGYDITWQELPVGRAYLYLEHGIIDLWLGSAGVPKLAPFTLEAAFQPGNIRLNAYYREDTPPVDSIPDLQGKSLILIRGYTYWQLLDRFREDPNTAITIAPSHRSAIRMLAVKRGDYLINFQSPMDNILSQSPSPDLQYSNLLERPMAFVFSREAPDTDQMVNALNRAWTELESKGLLRVPD